MVRAILVVAGLAAGATAVIAQTDVIKARQNLMDEMNNAARPTYRMLRGQAPFDLNQVQTALRTFVENAPKAAALFPENSKAGDTAALPAVWERKADFEANFPKLTQDARGAMTTIRDEATFKAEYPKVIQICNDCHDKFRKPS
jgi:cytochrome c556